MSEILDIAHEIYNFLISLQSPISYDIIFPNYKLRSKWMA